MRDFWAKQPHRKLNNENVYNTLENIQQMFATEKFNEELRKAERIKGSSESGYQYHLFEKHSEKYRNYLAMVSRLTNFKNEHKFILLCNSSTTPSQIESFVQRVYFDNFKNIYFVMDPQQLSNQNQQHLLG